MRKHALVATILAALCSTAIAAEGVGRNVTYFVKVMQGTESVSSVSLVTMDGVEVPFELTTKHGYLKSCSADGKSASCEGDTVKTGLSMKFLPAVERDGRIKTHFVFAESDLDSIQSITSNGMTIQMPQVSRTDLEQTVMMVPGEMIELPFVPVVDRGDGAAAWKGSKFRVAVTAALDGEQMHDANQRIDHAGLAGMPVNGQLMASEAIRSIDQVPLFDVCINGTMSLTAGGTAATCVNKHWQLLGASN